MFKTVAMPPVCIWGTLLDSKFTIVRNKVQANINQGSHVVAKSLYDTKEKIMNHKKQKTTESVSETMKETTTSEEVKEETTNFNEVETGNDSNTEPTVNVQENNVFVGPDFTQFQNMDGVQETSYGPDFSNLQNGVIYDIDPSIPMPEAIVSEYESKETTAEQPQEEPELYEVTPEDIDHILKNMQGGAKL